MEHGRLGRSLDDVPYRTIQEYIAVNGMKVMVPVIEYIRLCIETLLMVYVLLYPFALMAITMISTVTELLKASSIFQVVWYVVVVTIKPMQE